MDYLSQRQRIISQTSPTPTTPNYRPQDYTSVDFNTVLKGCHEAMTKGVQMVATNLMHVGFDSKVADPKAAQQKKVYEVAPDGNAVIMEEQMLNSSQTQMDSRQPRHQPSISEKRAPDSNRARHAITENRS